MDFSARKAGKASQRRLAGSLELTSMVDVIFLLLIYFLMTISYTPPEARLTPALQAERVGGGRSADLEPQLVHVEIARGAPVYRIGERTMTDAGELALILERLPKEGGVFVRGDNAVPVGFGVAAMQASYAAGFVKVTYVPGK